MRHTELMNLAAIVLTSMVAAPSGADTFEDFSSAQDVIRRMVSAYGGAETLRNLASTSFETESTYFAFHQSMGTGDRWDEWAQRRHYAIDLERGTAAFGRAMAEWSLQNVYLTDESIRIDHERGAYTRSGGATIGSYAHVLNANPALIARHLLVSPYGARRRGSHRAGEKQLDEVFFVDSGGRGATILVDQSTGLIEELQFVSRVPPFGDVLRTVHFEGYANVGEIMMATIIEPESEGISSSSIG